MAASIQNIRDWFREGVANGKDYMVIVCDTYDYEDYPLFCSESTLSQLLHSYREADMQIIMEIYDLRKDIAAQISKERTGSFDVAEDIVAGTFQCQNIESSI